MPSFWIEDSELTKKLLGFATSFARLQQGAAGDQRPCDGSNKLDDRLMRNANGIRGYALAEHVSGNACFSENRGSYRYTKMLVSISAVTIVETVPCPSPPWQSRSSQQRTVESLFPLSFRRSVEMLQPVVRQDRGFRSLTRRNDSDGLSAGSPLNLIARLDVKALRDRLWESYLQLACDFTHILT